jgi:hypothetical protein
MNRRTLNQEIWKTLIEQGHVESRGRAHDILVPRQDMTKVRVAYARYYDAGDVLHFDRAHERQGIAKDSYPTVQAVDRTGNLLTLQYSNGRTIESVSDGDPLFACVDLDAFPPTTGAGLLRSWIRYSMRATLKFDSGRVLKGPLSPHIDLGYASTSHSAQVGRSTAS